MNTKLTLNLDKNISEEAKSYAKENKVSPLVESLTGIISSDIDERKSY
jgi:hypothetical protein